MKWKQTNLFDRCTQHFKEAIEINLFFPAFAIALNLSLYYLCGILFYYYFFKLFENALIIICISTKSVFLSLKPVTNNAVNFFLKDRQVYSVKKN